MSDVCFSGAALALLGAMGGVLLSAGGVLFRGWITSLQDRVKAVEEERDRAADNFERSLHLGEVVVQKRAGKRG